MVLSRPVWQAVDKTACGTPRMTCWGRSTR